jgi:hypothetical protein
MGLVLVVLRPPRDSQGEAASNGAMKREAYLISAEHLVQSGTVDSYCIGGDLERSWARKMEV